MSRWRGWERNGVNAGFGLLAHQAGVGAIGGDQLVVRADLYGTAIVENEDAIGVDDA